MTPKNKKENALGRGLDALIRKDYLDEEDKTDKLTEIEMTKKSGSKTKKSEIKQNKTSDKDITDITAETETVKNDKKSLSVDDKVIEAVLQEVHKNPRISLWSAKSAAVLRFLKKTKPEFSISSEASLLIEEAVKNQHPEIWKLFEEKGL